MKNLFIALIALVLFSCQSDKFWDSKEIALDMPMLAISGTFLNTDADSMALYNHHNDLIMKFGLDENGSFADTIFCDEGIYSIRVADQRASLYLDKAASLNIHCNYDNFDSSLVFTGSLAQENDYLNHKGLLRLSIRSLTSPYYFGKLSEVEFLKSTDSLFTLQEELLNQYDSLSANFVAYEEKDLFYEKQNRLAQYESVKQYLDKDSSFRVSAKFPVIDYSIVENEKLAASINYRDFLSDALNKQFNFEEKEDYFFEMAKAVNEGIKSQKIKDELMYGSLKYSLDRANKIDSLVAIFNKVVENEDYKAYINKQYKALASIKPGMQSPGFNLPSHSGEMVDLTSLKGKVVYIDIWATWCGPCIREIPSLKQLEKDMHKDNIAFVSISSNDDREKWFKMVNDKELGGIQLFAADDNNQFIKDYLVNSIPRFIILDENGVIVDSNAKRPSNPELKAELKALLNKAA